MAVQTDFLDVGFFVAGQDFRNSTLTGTTLPGPNGSGQFLAVYIGSTDLSVAVLTTSSTLTAVGIIQNKPSTGLAADVKVFGVSKAVCGSTATAIVAGLSVSAYSGQSTYPGACVAYTSTCGYAIGMAITAPSTIGSLFSVLLYGPAGRGVNGLAAGL